MSLVSVDSVLDRFRRVGALLEGHFRLTSGLHSPGYLQCALVLQHPREAEACGAEIAARVKDLKPQVVLSPALGGIVIGQEVGRALGVRAIFAERQDGKLSLRRGFALEPRERVLVVEDVVTTGMSTRETIEVARAAGATVVGAASIIDRSGGQQNLDVPFQALATVSLPTYQPESCPLCAAGQRCGEAGFSRLRLRRVTRYPTPIPKNPNPFGSWGTEVGSRQFSDKTHAQADTRLRRHSTRRLATTSRGESVQGLLEDALARFEGASVNVHGAGRTDAGVHALGQVASAVVGFNHDVTTLQRALNAHLPPDIRVLSVADADPEFHARFSSRGKTYQYRIRSTPVAIHSIARTSGIFPNRSISPPWSGQRRLWWALTISSRFRAQAVKPAEPLAPSRGRDGVIPMAF